MDKIKFIMLENDKFSMAVNYSDIVAIQNKNKDGVEVMLESNFVNRENKYKILKLDFDYDKIVDNLKDDFNFVKIGNVLINKNYDNCLLSSTIFPSKTEKDYFQFDDISVVAIEDNIMFAGCVSLSVNKNVKQNNEKCDSVKRISIKTANDEEEFQKTIFANNNEIESICEQLNNRDDFIKVEQNNKIIFININIIISCVKVDKTIYILTFDPEYKKIELKCSNNIDAELTHSVIMGALDFKQEKEEENNKFVSYEYKIPNKFNF